MGQLNKSLNLIPAAELLNKVKSGKNVKLDDGSFNAELFPEEFIKIEMAAKGFAVSSSKKIIAAVNTEITAELRQEGLVRDLIRQVQNLRKDSGLNVEDRIRIGISGSSEIQKALSSHESYFMNEVLGVKLQLKYTDTLDFSESVKINGQQIQIGISPIN